MRYKNISSMEPMEKIAQNQKKVENG